MKIQYCNGWSKEKILAWLRERPNARQTFYDGNGYTIRFADGATWAHEYGEWIGHTPSKCFINGTIAQITYD